MLNFVTTTVVAAALGVALALVFAQISDEYCIHLRDLDLCHVDDVKAMIAAQAEILRTSSFWRTLACVRFAASTLVKRSRKLSTWSTMRSRWSWRQ